MVAEPTGRLRWPAWSPSRGEVLHHLMGDVVVVLHRGRLHEVGRGADQWSADAPVEHEAPVLEQTGEEAVDDRGADLALDVVADDGKAGLREAAGPLGIRGDEDRDGVDESYARLEARLGVVLLGHLRPHRQVRDED